MLPLMCGQVHHEIKGFRLRNIFNYDGAEYEFPAIRKGDRVAFYLSEHTEEWFVGLVTSVLSSTRVHISVFEPNGFTVRKKVDIATSDRLRYRWLPLDTAHDLEEDTA